MLTIFGRNFEIEERCKGVHCVGLGESFPTSIYLQKSASIQPRTSLSKFGEKFNSLFIRLLRAKPPARRVLQNYRPLESAASRCAGRARRSTPSAPQRGKRARSKGERYHRKVALREVERNADVEAAADAR